MANMILSSQQVEALAETCIAAIGAAQWRRCIYDGEALSVPADLVDIVAAFHLDPRPGLVAYAAGVRWQHEMGGVAVPGVGIVPTDDRTRGVITAAYVKAKASESYTVENWKAGPGVYVTLTASEIIAIGDAIEAHVAACFAINRLADEAIEAGAVTTTAAIDALAWPG